MASTGPSAASNAPSPTAKLEPLLARWQSAQSRGDFETYERLYAKQFVGIKRVGAQTFRFDRRRWLVDRKGMLAHKPEVGVSGLSVTDSGKTLVARFEQTYSAKSFKDVGTKQLVLLEEDGELKIGREEMLTSLVTAAAGVVAFPDFAFVLHRGGRPFALLERREPEPRAALELVDHESALTRVSDEQALPESRRGLTGREISLYGESGEVCRNRVARVVTLALAVPHFGQSQHWAGQNGDAPTPKAEIARQLVEMADKAGSYLALELAPNPACSKALWARASERPAPVLFTRRGATAVEQRSVLSAFEHLPVHEENQQAFLQEGGTEAKGPWYLFHGGRPNVYVFESKARTWLSLSSEVGHGCGEYRREAWSLFESKAGQLALASHDAAHRSVFAPVAAFDADGDGSPELLSHNLRLAQIRDGRHDIVLEANIPVFACGC